jgi:predicted RNA-binding protein with RPS1 domain
VYDKIDKDYVESVETVGPQLDKLEVKITALQAHSKARETTAKAQTANWKEISRQYAPAGVIAQAEFEDQMNDLKLDKEREDLEVGANQNAGNGSEDVEMG